MKIFQSLVALPVFILSMASCVVNKVQSVNSPAKLPPIMKTDTNKKLKSYLDLSWKEVATRMPDEWYGSDEARKVADSVLKYQTAIGGWPKNSGFHTGVKQDEAARIMSSGIGATFDNGATLTEMIFLTKMYSKVKDDRYLKAFNKAVNYIFEAQYNNGGWPQFYPVRPQQSVSYSGHITYNDDAMVNVMKFLKDIADQKPSYAHMEISPDVKKKAEIAFNKGVDCILKTQIKVRGQRNRMVRAT